MNIPVHPAIIRASVSVDGLLLSADAPLLALQREAGGDLAQVLAIPQLASIARLCRRLGVTVSRPVTAAADRGDIDMWVRAHPEKDGTMLSIVDWREHPSLVRTDEPRRAADLAALAEGWTWQIDMQLQFQLVLEGGGAHGSFPPDPPVPGHWFSAYFQLQPDEEGDMAMLRGLAQRRAFRGQRAALTADSARLFELSGFPLFDLAGQLTGYRGSAFPVERGVFAPAVEDAPALAIYPEEFGRRLDRSLRRPLGRIIANADTISAQLEGPLRPDYAGYAQDIASAGRHLMALIDDLADLQAIDRADFKVISEEVDLADLGRRAAGLLSVKALDKGMRIIAPHPDDSVMATGEFRRVLQILVNLIGNAVRYAPDGSEILVVTEHDGGGQAIIMVIDQGPGIAVAERERIFDKFERLGRDDSGGSGLGLYISRRLARAMKGDIRIGGGPGEGARFILALPAL